MNVRVYWHRVRACMVWGGAVAAAAGCSDSTISTTPSVTRSPVSPALAVASPGDPANFDHFTADVSIHAQTANARGEGTLSHDTHFQVERERNAGGKWATVVRFDPPKPDGVGKPHGTPPGLARIEVRDGEMPEAYDFDGNKVDVLAGTNTYERVQKATGVQATGRPPFALRAPEPPATPTSRAQEVRAWVESMVLTPQARQHARAALLRRFGPAKGTEKGLERFHAERNNVEMEVLVDPATDLVAEQRMTRDGAVAQRVTFEYGSAGNGVYVQRRARVEFPARDKERAGQVVDVTIANVRLEKRGGA